MYPAFRDHVPGFAAWFERPGPAPRGRCRVGETFWMPLRPDARPHGVVVVVAAGGPATAEDKAAIAVRAAIDEAVRAAPGRARARRPAAGRPARLPRRHGRRPRPPAPLGPAQVAAAREALAPPPGRRRGLHRLHPGDLPDLPRGPPRGPRRPAARPGARPPALERALIDGECVLFVGAGLSRGAGLPDWGELVGRMAGELGVAPHDRLDYLDLAQWYRERFGQAALAGLVRETFGDPAPLAPADAGPLPADVAAGRATSSRPTTTTCSSGPCRP